MELNAHSKRFSYSIKTLGCKANIYDSMILENEIMGLGGVRNDDTPDLYILNSCTVTNGADKQSLLELQNFKKKSPKTLSLMTGCFVQVAEEKLSRNTSIDMLVPNDSKQGLKKLIAEKMGIEGDFSEAFENEVYWGQLPLFSGKTRAFLKIQEGCNDNCTYCIIPAARGKSRSVRLGLLLQEINRLVEAGVKEVILTGINIADYGLDFDSCLEDLVEAILTKTKLKRLRLSSLDPGEVTPRLLELMKKNSALMPHFHVSLQSANSRVLRAMKRKYRQEQVVDCLNQIHQNNPDTFVGMDVIAGFPSETEEEHENTMTALKDLPWTRLHVFPYSERTGTPALKIPGANPNTVRKQRAKELLELSLIRHRMSSEKFLNGNVKNVLFEAPYFANEECFVAGHAENYHRVLVKTDSVQAHGLMNQIRDVRIHALSPKPAQDWTLEGVLL